MSTRSSYRWNGIICQKFQWVTRRGKVNIVKCQISALMWISVSSTFLYIDTGPPPSTKTICRHKGCIPKLFMNNLSYLLVCIYVCFPIQRFPKNSNVWWLSKIDSSVHVLVSTVMFWEVSEIRDWITYSKMKKLGLDMKYWQYTDLTISFINWIYCTRDRTVLSKTGHLFLPRVNIYDHLISIIHLHSRRRAVLLVQQVWFLVQSCTSDSSQFQLYNLVYL